MWRKIVSLALVCMLILSASAAAHSGRTDSRGGHNCSQKSKDKGLCSGYHYHNGGSSGASSGSSSKSGGSSSSSSSSSKSSGSSSSGGSSSRSAGGSSSSSASAPKTSDIIIYINDERFYPEPKPITVGGATLLPIRSIGEALGAQVAWEESTSSITVTKAAKTVKLKLGSKKASVNGSEETLGSAPLMHRDAVFAPIRVVAEGVGATVHFDSGANALYISYS